MMRLVVAAAGVKQLTLTHRFALRVQAGLLEPTPGAVELVRELIAAGVPCAIVSSGNRGYIEKAPPLWNVAVFLPVIL